MKRSLTAKRYASGSAYIDSGVVTGYILGCVLFAVWIAFETRAVVSPVWLGGSIIALSLYQVMMLWILNQHWEIDRIFGIFINNIVCLGLYFLVVEWLVGVQLSTDLPVLNTIFYLAGYESTSISPGAVALSYTAVAVIVGVAMSVFVWLVELTKWSERLKRALNLDKLDLVIDNLLDRLAFWMEHTRYAWLIVPLILLAGVMSAVIGIAALFN